MTDPTKPLAFAPATLGIDLASEEAGPKPVLTLHERRSPLAAPDEQLRVLGDVDLPGAGGRPARFDETLRAAGIETLAPARLEIFQVNMGKLCNMACKHCHVDAGPHRVAEVMTRETIDDCLTALDRTDAHTVDITGGAPELNPNFGYLVDEAVARGKHVIDRCNLTVLLMPTFQHLPVWLAERGVEIVCSLPHYRRRNTDAQRGRHAFAKSIEAIRRLNAVGYGKDHADRTLTIMTNPAGAFPAGSQSTMTAEWKRFLERDHGVTFDRLIALNNMPIARYLEWLIDSGNLGGYMKLLVSSFNPAAVAGVMCRNTISVSWDGRIYGCDFNQMLEMDAEIPESAALIAEFDPEAFARRRIVTHRHCYGCTAGAGSSCGGATSG